MENQSTLADWNGVISPLQELMVPVLDRAFLFGDAVYEVMRVKNGQPLLLEEHFERLRASLSGVRISYDLDLLRHRILALLARTPQLNGYLYCQVTRGAGERKHVPAAGMQPNCLLYAQALAPDLNVEQRRKGIAVDLVPDPRWQRCRLKTTSLIANVLAKIEAQEDHCEEVIFYNREGFVTEGSHTNVFAFAKGILHTPYLDENILAGITRSKVIELCDQLGIATRIDRLEREALLRADEVFLTGTLAGVLPVVRIDQTQIGNGQPGVRTRELIERFI